MEIRNTSQAEASKQIVLTDVAVATQYEAEHHGSGLARAVGHLMSDAAARKSRGSHSDMPAHGESKESVG